jgi:hypothetical protein
LVYVPLHSLGDSFSGLAQGKRNVARPVLAAKEKAGKQAGPQP